MRFNCGWRKHLRGGIIRHQLFLASTAVSAPPRARANLHNARNVASLACGRACTFRSPSVAALPFISCRHVAHSQLSNDGLPHRAALHLPQQHLRRRLLSCTSSVQYAALAESAFTDTAGTCCRERASACQTWPRSHVMWPSMLNACWAPHSTQ